jgi:hypothetical protein
MSIEALKLAAKWGPVFPLHCIMPSGYCTCGRSDCNSPGKHPRTRNGVKDATREPDQIKEWWTRWPGANVGLAVGKDAGVWVLDIDGKVGAESLAELEAEIGKLPATLEVRTGGGGRHLYFLWPKDRQIRNKQGVRPKIDVRGQDGYVLLPPSNHESGRLYEWANSAQVAPAPAALKDLVAPKEHRPPWSVRPSPKPAPKPRPAATTNAPTVEERAVLYLEQCAAAIQGGGGHSALLWAARAMVVGFELDRDTAIRLLWQYYNPRCVPQWDIGKPSDKRDFERKVDEAIKTPGHKPRGWLKDETNIAAAAMASQADVDALIASAGIKVEELQELEEVDESEDLPPEIPAHLLSPPGLVGRMVSYINETAGCPQPLLALGAALVTCGVIFGRKVRDCSNGRTNLFAMGIAHSSSGKDHAPDVCEQLLDAAGGAHLRGGMMTGDGALETALSKCEAMALYWDECGHLMAAIKAASGTNPHLATMVPMLMRLYSSAHKAWIGKQRSQAEPVYIDQPHVCLWGYTSPEVFYRGVTDSELRDGWLGRIMVFVSDDKPMYEIKESKPLPAELVEEVRAWISYRVPDDLVLGDIAGKIRASQILYDDSPEAAAVFRAFGSEAYGEKIKAGKVGDPIEYLWGKALQNARRVALIVAAGEALEGRIEAHHAQFGVDLVRYNLQQFAWGIAQHAGGNEFEDDCQRILTKIRQPKYQPRTKLLRSSKMLSKRFNEIIATLIERGDVIEQLRQTKGRPVRLYLPAEVTGA